MFHGGFRWSLSPFYQAREIEEPICLLSLKQCSGGYPGITQGPRLRGGLQAWRVRTESLYNMILRERAKATSRE
jgi:hypothetical protein